MKHNLKLLFASIYFIAVVLSTFFAILEIQQKDIETAETICWAEKYQVRINYHERYMKEVDEFLKKVNKKENLRWPEKYRSIRR